MLLFIISTVICLVVSAGLLVLFIRTLHNNWRQKNRRPISYLAPVILMIVFILFSVYLSIPRLLDIVFLTGQTLNIEEIQLSQNQIGRFSFTYNEQRFHYSAQKFDINPGQTFRVSYTPYSRHVIEAINLTENITDQTTVR